MKNIKFLAVVTATVLSLGTSIAAQAALAIVAHPSNSVSGIRADDAQRIFLGKSGEFANGRAGAAPLAQLPFTKPEFPHPSGGVVQEFPDFPAVPSFGAAPATPLSERVTTVTATIKILLMSTCPFFRQS